MISWFTRSILIVLPLGLAACGSAFKTAEFPSAQLSQASQAIPAVSTGDGSAVTDPAQTTPVTSPSPSPAPAPAPAAAPVVTPMPAPAPAPAPEATPAPSSIPAPSSTPAPSATPAPSPAPASPAALVCDGGLTAQDGQCMTSTEDDSRLLQPKMNQVYQRSTLASGQIRVSFVGVPSADQVAVTVTSANGAVLLAKEESVSFKVNAIYNKKFAVPAGGWYSVEVRQINSVTKQITRSYAAKVGVGDVFIAAGQSNSVNSGETPVAAASSMVVAFDPKSNTWGAANDPLPAYTADGAGVSFGGSTWPAMLDSLAQTSNVPQALVLTGYGGTSVGQWQKGHPTGNFARLETILQEIVAQTGGFRFILWHQGESDVPGARTNLPYQAQFQQMTMDLSADLGGAKIPWMMAHVSFVPANNYPNGGACDTVLADPTGAQFILQAQANLITAGIAYDGPQTDDLSGAGFRYSGAGGMCIHFSRAGSVAGGQRWATKVAAAPFVPYLAEPAFWLRDEVFRPDWYLGAYPDLQAAFAGNQYIASSHWLTYGIGEGRRGSPWFSAVDYLARYSDVASASGTTNYLSATWHYVNFGIAEGRNGL